ncbi:alpha/beta hydrolase [Lentisphaerota bacterium WC36G]|nr:alpha/beta hydrolase [Lentisphaerae bacterium WC36]
MKKNILNINNCKLAVYEDGKVDGDIILFLHGFGSYSYTWERLIPFLARDYKIVCIDLKGFGASECENSDTPNVSPLDNVNLIKELIVQRNYKNINIVGHSLGGLIAFLLAFDEEIKPRINKINLIASSGYFYHLPDFINELRSTVAKKIFVKYLSNEVLVRIVLNQLIFDRTKITSEDIENYAKPLKVKNSRRVMIEAAKQIDLGNIAIKKQNLESLDIPILITWGENDKFLSLDDVKNITQILPSCRVVAISNCGHAPQFEKSDETAIILRSFIEGALEKVTNFYEEENLENQRYSLYKFKYNISEGASVDNDEKMTGTIHDIVLTASQKEPIDWDFGNKTSITNKGKIDHDMPKVKLRNLVDKWSISVFVLLVFLKILQIMRKIGFRAEETGWRKATGIYLRNEHSKFCLATFRLKIPQNVKYSENLKIYDRQCQNIIHNLAYMIRRTPEFHWRLDWRLFRVKRLRHYFVDIVQAEYDDSGKLVGLETFLENEKHTFTGMSDEFKKAGLNAFIKFYNKSLNLHDKRRPMKLKKDLHRWIKKFRPKLAFLQRTEMHDFLMRVMSATFISFDVLAKEDKNSKIHKNYERLSTPLFSKLKHPGAGLLNLKCRLTHDLREADLWFQYHHMPVDGQPMQEVLDNLKNQWGSWGVIEFPVTQYSECNNDKGVCLEESSFKNYEIFQTESYGRSLWYGRFFVDFSKILELRKKINAQYYDKMGGNCTLVGLLIWGMGQFREYHDKKFLIPVDLHELEEHHTERDLSLVVIRPTKFIDETKDLDGLVEFQREFNLRMRATQLGLSASYELIEIFALSTPLLSTLVQRILPKAFSEFVGTTGVSVIRNAEVFVAPLSEFHSDGFIAVGNVSMPCSNGSLCGSVSVRGSQQRVEHFYSIVGKVLDYYDKLEI